MRSAAFVLLLPLLLGNTVAGCGDDADRAASSAVVASGTTAGESRGAAPARAVDAAFVRQMIPHHQAVVSLAETALDQAEHPELQALARSIIATQNDEIGQLDAIRQDLGVEEAGSPADRIDHDAVDSGDTNGGATHDVGAMKAAAVIDARTLGLAPSALERSMDPEELLEADPFDTAFIDGIRPLHEGAIAMAGAALAGGEDRRLLSLAETIRQEQARQLKQMAAWKAQW